MAMLITFGLLMVTECRHGQMVRVTDEASVDAHAGTVYLGSIMQGFVTIPSRRRRGGDPPTVPLF